jgi:aryl-alcohol dehydrogenase-like predicted oxidoreductase
VRTRPLGSTGLRVSEIGFGAWGIGGRTAGATSYGATDDAVSRRALAVALDRGITFFDTAPAYGDGHSERLIGEAVRGRRDRVVIATKAGLPGFAAPPDFSPAALHASLEGSLRRLGTDCVDLLQLHNPSLEELRARPEIVDALDGFRRAGLVRAVGLSLKSPADGPAAVRDLGVRQLQVNLNMLDLRALDCGLLDLSVATGTGIVARTPLAFGFLAARMAPGAVFPPDDHRSLWPREQVDRWIAAADTLFARIPATATGTLPRGAAAIAFCLSLPGVSTVIPGLLTAAEVEAAVDAVAAPLSADAVADVVAAYRTLDLSVARPPVPQG